MKHLPVLYIFLHTCWLSWIHDIQWTKLNILYRGFYLSQLLNSVKFILLAFYMYYLQHERPCCIGYTNSSRRRELVYPIQHGRECCKWLVKFISKILCFHHMINLYRLIQNTNNPISILYQMIQIAVVCIGYTKAIIWPKWSDMIASCID